MKNGPSILQIVGLVILVGVVLYFAVYKELRGRGMLPGQKKLLQTGVAARAKVLQAQPTGSFFGSKGNTHQLQEIALVLEIQPPNGPAYSVKTTRAVPTSGLSNPFRVGRELDVKVDAFNPNKIAIVGFDG